MKSSIIDVPRKPSQADLFGIQVYQDALIKYIRLTDTPITIALQGEWGSGKTSLMNQLRYNLCDQEGAPYFAVWINTWQFSLMKTPQQAIISILEGIINQIGQLNPNKHKWEESKRKIGGVFKKMATIGTKVAAGVVGVEGDVVDDLFSPDARESDIAQLKEEIARLIEDALAHDASKQGFTFYIDDLNRIDPPVAVEILELLKNIFDLERCVFILAIDYDVVEEPDFKNWNDRIASRLKLRPLTEVPSRRTWTSSSWTLSATRPSRQRRERWNSLATARWTTPSAWRTRTSLSAATGRPPARGSLRSSRSSSTWPAPGTESG